MMTRRKLALAAMGSGAAALAQPAQPEDDLAAARKQAQSNADALAKFELPMSAEPAFVFKA
ncbi:MAG: hypothetical protein HYR60_09040 [Acidobacteria bacterium]|nr:hypothetical protein [Acidobacteriota bacterium]